MRKKMEIREIRKKLGMTQEQFAHALGVTFGSVNRWESSKSKPSPMARQKIEEFNKRINDEKASQ